MEKLTNALAARFASPTRSTRLTVVLGRWLGLAFMVCFFTGVFSHNLQEQPSWMFYPTRPVWLYQLTQGVHVTAGIAAIPLLLAKLWSVYPELLKWPPVKSVWHALERASIALFIGSSLIQLLTGLVNTYKWYPWPFPFRETHYWLAWVIVGSLALHIALKLPAIMTHWRARPADSFDATADAAAAPEPADSFDAATHADAAAAPEHAAEGAPEQAATAGHATHADAAAGSAPAGPGRWSRRAFLAAVGTSTGVVVLTTAGQSLSWLDPLNFFAPRKKGTGPQSVPVNRTAEQANVVQLAGAADWKLTVTHDGKSRAFSLAELSALPQHEHELPIACVEGWSQTARWRGVRVPDLLAAVGAPASSLLKFTSLEPEGAYRIMTMPAAYARDERTLVALELNGETLDIDHGYPARIIAPARPGVLQTKWLQSMEVL